MYEMLKEFIKPELLVLIPVLYLFGAALKHSSVADKHIHLIVGGFPCQGFSMAGHRVVADPRNSLYLEMLEIVKRLQPDFVVMENVEGLRSMLNGKVEAKIISEKLKRQN